MVGQPVMNKANQLVTYNAGQLVSNKAGKL